jgi:hypothetical protein
MERTLARLIAAFIAIALGGTVFACEFRGPVPIASTGVAFGR